MGVTITETYSGKTEYNVGNAIEGNSKSLETTAASANNVAATTTSQSSSSTEEFDITASQSANTPMGESTASPYAI